METKLLKVLEDLYEIRVHLERKSFSAVQRRRVDRSIRIVRNMLVSSPKVTKPTAKVWPFLKSSVGIGLLFKGVDWVLHTVKSIIQGE